MCMVDFSDGTITVLHERYPTARIAHKCNECNRAISPGEKYMVERYVFDGDAKTHKTCAHCCVVRQWLASECGGWMYGGLHEDISEHGDDPHYGVGVKMLSVGMDRKWKRRDGRPWPIPRMPKTTDQRMATGD